MLDTDFPDINRSGAPARNAAPAAPAARANQAPQGRQRDHMRPPARPAPHRALTLRPRQPDTSPGPMPTFTHARSEQSQAGFRLYGPEIFRTYCRRHGLRADTAGTISVDHARTLSKELRDAHTMVLRLRTGEALGCDDSSIHMIPATGAGTYSFRVIVGSEHPQASAPSRRPGRDRLRLHRCARRPQPRVS